MAPLRLLNFKQSLSFIGLLFVLFNAVACSLEAVNADVLPSVDVANAMSNSNIITNAQSEGTAVLFLIDESAGVSGKSRCPNVPDNLILPVDEQAQMRYKFTRFYLALWQTYYAQEGTPDFWRNTSTNRGQQPSPPPPPLVVGIAQFAKDYRDLLPLTSIEDVYSGDKLDVVLPEPIDVLQDKPSDWSCYTDFNDAISRAVQDLINTGMPDLHLVLLTDGVFRGWESEASNETIRAEVATSLRDDVLGQVQTDINIKVLLLGKNICIASDDPTCAELTDGEYALRHSDWGRWSEWQNEGLITLLDSGNPLPDFAQYVQHLLPASGRFLPVDGGGWYPLTTLSGNVDNTHLVLLTSGNLNGLTVYYREGSDQNGRIAATTPSYSGITSEVHHIQSTLQPVTASGCSSYTSWLPLQQSGRTSVYYWEDSNVTQPSLQNLELSSTQVEINGSNPLLTVSVELAPDSISVNPNCYQVFFKLGDGLPVYVDLPSSNNGSQIVEYTFNNEFFPDTLDWGDIQLNAGIVLKNATNLPPIGSPPQPQTVKVVYSLAIPLSSQQISETLVAPNGDPQATVLTIPISYADKFKKLQSDFIPEFGVFPGEPQNYYACAVTPLFSVATPETLCIPPERTWEKAQVEQEVQGNDILYRLQFPYYEVREPACDYRYLRVRWVDPVLETEQCRWFEIVQTFSPIPTPIPTQVPSTIAPPTVVPTSTPEVPEGVCQAGAFPILTVALMSLLIQRKKTKFI